MVNISLLSQSITNMIPKKATIRSILNAHGALTRGELWERLQLCDSSHQEISKTK